MVPSVDPLPFKVVLGYKGYPTDTDFVAMTEMPLQGASLGEQTKPCWTQCYVTNPVIYRGEVHLDAAT